MWCRNILIIYVYIAVRQCIYIYSEEKCKDLLKAAGNSNGIKSHTWVGGC